MSWFEITAILITLTALLSYLNAKFIRLPNTIGLMLTSLLLGVVLYLPGEASAVQVVAMLLGTMTFAQLGALGAALTVSLGRGGLLMVFLVLPMYVPVLVFGVSAVEQAAGGWPATGPLALLAAMACLSTAFISTGQKQATQTEFCMIVCRLKDG